MIVETPPARPGRELAPALAPAHGARRARLALIAEWRRRNDVRRAEAMTWSVWMAGAGLAVSTLKVLAVLFVAGGA